jgi:hypothetical protein
MSSIASDSLMNISTPISILIFGMAGIFSGAALAALLVC